MIGWIVLIVLVVLLFAAIGIYNTLVRLRKRCDNGWAQIDVQLKRRYDLIPNLVETAKGYLKHEREVLENVTKARQQAIDASGVADQAKAENFLSQTLRSLFAVVENYPDLKGNQSMMAVQEELVSTENKISFARQHYNDTVMVYNTRTEVFPSNVVAGMFGFKPRDFFELEDAAQREAPKVDFS
ncbi:MAG: LemA family protein [Candidatus Krumholzibacteriota bacterium]|nr:LemA family protein [Candidatus Krumholzibacteriota bacterium]